MRGSVTVVFLMMVAMGCGGDSTHGVYTMVDAQIWVDETTFDFGHVAVGDMAARTLTIHSTGRDTLFIEELAIQGPGTFFIDEGLTERIPPACNPEDRATIGCQGTTTLEVGWIPQREQLAEANLIIVSNDRTTSPIDVQLWGNSFSEN